MIRVLPMDSLVLNKFSQIFKNFVFIVSIPVFLAITHMDKLKVFGKNIRVMLSKHQSVQMPKEGQPDAGLTKDYTQSPLHRFKKPGSKNYQNIYPPSSTLHLSNIPATVNEDDIKDAFAKNGFTVKAFKFFP